MGDFALDALALVGLLLVGVAVWLAFGLASTLAYAGAACLVLAAVLAFVPHGGDRGQP